MILYHYTCQAHIADIMRTGALLLTESHISPKRRNHAPPVVWLSKSDDPTGMFGLDHDSAIQKLDDYAELDKHHYRIMVDLRKSEAQAIEPFAKRHGMAPQDLDKLLRQKGARRFYVATKPITMDAWVSVHDLFEDRVVWLPGPRPQRRSRIGMPV